MPGKAPNFQAGEILSASKLNKTSELINQAVRLRPFGSTPVVSPVKTVLLRLEVFAINDAQREMTCGTPGTFAAVGRQDYTVRLLEIFTEPSRAGVNYSYTGLNTRVADPGSENQEITPPFVLGETIYAIFDFQTREYFFFGDGRMWAQVP